MTCAMRSVLGPPQQPGRAAEVGKLNSGLAAVAAYVVNLGTAAWHEWVQRAWRSLTEVEPQLKRPRRDRQIPWTFSLCVHLEDGDVAFM